MRWGDGDEGDEGGGGGFRNVMQIRWTMTHDINDSNHIDVSKYDKYFITIQCVQCDYVFSSFSFSLVDTFHDISNRSNPVVRRVDPSDHEVHVDNRV